MINTWPGWQNVRLLGEGSFGKVYEIFREEFGFPQRAALKVITIPQSPSEIDMAYQDGMDQKSVTDYFHSFVEELISEFALMYQLKGNNTNVVSYEDHMVVQHEDSIGWDILIRMELLTPLPKYIENHPLSERDVVRLGIDICHALEICRNYGLIHRDIKPENIFWSEETGFYKLGDFGVARVAEKTVSNFSKKGTYSYMAPEVYRGLPYSFSVDIYSLGIVLYRYLNHGRLPFLPKYPETIRFRDRETALERRIGGMEAIPEPDNGSPALKAAVLKACAYDPQDRFATPTEFRQALEAAETEIMDADTVKVEEDAGLATYTVGFFDQTTRQKKEKEKAAEEIPVVEKPEDSKAAEVVEKPEDNKAVEVVEKPEDNKAVEVVEKPEDSQEIEAAGDVSGKQKKQKKPKKPALPKMPILYRILGWIVPILCMLITYKKTVYFTMYFVASFYATFRVPFSSVDVRKWDGSFYYVSSIHGLVEDGPSICLRLLPVVLVCILMGNLLEVLISGKSHIRGTAGRMHRISSGVLVALLVFVIYLSFHRIAGYLIAFLYQIRCGYILAALVEAIVTGGIAYLISRIAAHILRGKKKSS